MNLPHIRLRLIILWLGRRPIFAPSWMLFTHCNTRGFWIHCPWELPHQGCLMSVCKNWAFARTSRTEPCIWEVVKLTAKSTEEFMKTSIVWACDLRNLTGSFFRVLFKRDFRQFMASYFSSHSAHLGGHQIHAHLIHTFETVTLASSTFQKNAVGAKCKSIPCHHVTTSPRPQNEIDQLTSVTSILPPRHFEKSMFSYLVDGIACGAN